jgi:hypothetical protein
MSKPLAVLVPPSLVRGRVRRLVESADGALFVQVWSGATWEAEPHALTSAEEVRAGLDAPPHILRALKVPERDWTSTDRIGNASLLTLWPLLEPLLSPAFNGLLLVN